MVTIRDVAGQSGFSVTTVSMVLNAGPASSRISARTRTRIWKVAKQLGYRPNLYARSLRSRRSHTMGVVVFDLTDPYCTQILRGIQNHLRPSGLFPIVTDLLDDGSQFHPCLDMLLGRRWKESSPSPTRCTSIANSCLNFRNSNIPAVVIGRELSDFPVSSVVMNRPARGKPSTTSMIWGTAGLRLSRDQILVDSVQRWQGLESFAEEVGMQLDPKLILEIKGRNSTYAEGYDLTDELIRRRSDFTALVAFDDLTACAAIRALTKAGRRVPKDCSVVGFDDVPSSAFYNPPLTTVHQQLELQARWGQR